MSVQPLLERFSQWEDRDAVVFRDETFSFGWLREEVQRWGRVLDQDLELAPGSVVALSADHSPRAYAILMALWSRRAVVALVSDAFAAERDEFYRVAQVQTEFRVDPDDRVKILYPGHSPSHPLLRALAQEQAPGLILFSSGSTGRSKAVVHHGGRLLARYHRPRRPARMLPFMLFDHVGGVITCLHLLSSGGTAVVTHDRSPDAVGRLVEAHRVEVLPGSPTFFRLFLLSGAADRFDLSSVQMVAYTSEVMPQTTLQRLRDVFPQAKLVQNYGLSEVGIIRTRSESSGSLWMKLKGEGFQWRVRDGHLEIKADAAMLGYLNEESPFTEDGWLMTRDRVEVRGEQVRVLGRDSDLIVVGGEKVYPSEIEDVLLTMDNVVDAAVSSEKNAITGNIVKARIQLGEPEERSAFRRRLQAFMSARVADYKIPQKIELTQEALYNTRLKKGRR